jgi:hypothetical protein
MISPYEFAQKQLELTAEFAQFIVDHPEVDEMLPEESYIYFEIAGEPEFNQYSRELGERRRAEGMATVCVQTRGLAPPQGSRLIDPVIAPLPAVA